MPAKIRLQRHGKKGRPFYHIVIADGRAPRDGRFIEKIGTYNPLTKPAEIILDFEKALQWLKNGAQPTETVRAILSYKGVLYKNHLLKGVTKGAMTVEQAEAKFSEWLQEKESKISSAKSNYELEQKNEMKKRLADEAKVKDARAQAIAEKRSQALAKEAEAKVEEQVETAEEAPADAEAVTESAGDTEKVETPEKAEEAEKVEEAKEPEKAEEATKSEEPKAADTEEKEAEKAESAEEAKTPETKENAEETPEEKTEEK